MLKKQQGSTLLVGLIMLVLLTLIAFSAMQSTTLSVQSVGNVQFREEASAAAQQVIERTISTDFSANPSAASSVGTVSVGGSNYTTQVKEPSCVRSVALNYNNLSSSSPIYSTCVGSATQQGGAVYLDASGKPIIPTSSVCYEQQWDVEAQAEDVNSGAKVIVHQGVKHYAPVEKRCL